MPGPGSYTVSTFATIAHTAEYVEEGTSAATFGVFPTNPTMNWIGANLSYDDTPNMNTIPLMNLGSEDLKYILKGKETYDVTLSYVPQTSTFLKYLVNSQGGGTGSIDASLSLLISPKINGVTNFLKITGARPDSGSIKWSAGKPLDVSVSLVSKSIPAYVTTDPIGTGAHASDPGTNPWKFDDPGAGGLTLAGTAYDFLDATVNFKRNLDRSLLPIGQAQVAYLPPLERSITGDISILLEDSTVYDTYLLTASPQTLVLPLKSGTSTLTLSNCVLEKLKRSYKVKATNVEQYSFVAETAVLT